MAVPLWPKINHQTSMTCTYGYSHFMHFKTVATEVEIQFLNTWTSLLPQFGSAFFSSKEGGVPILFFHIMNVQDIGVWWWIFGSRSAFKVTSEEFSWDYDLAFCRPVKFFHTDWIIISFWTLPYTQRHCHVRIEKGPVQTVAVKLVTLAELISI